MNPTCKGALLRTPRLLTSRRSAQFPLALGFNATIPARSRVAETLEQAGMALFSPPLRIGVFRVTLQGP